MRLQQGSAYVTPRGIGKKILRKIIRARGRRPGKGNKMRSQCLNTPRRGTKLLAIVLGAVMLAGCAVTLISSYDQETDKGITALQKSVDGLMNQLDQDPVPDYDALKKSYDTIWSEFSSLRFRSEARPNNTFTVKQLDELKAELDKLEKLHKDKKLNQAMVGPTREILNQTLRAILKLELEKKELNKKE
jgi:hypothetical protein